MTQFDESEAATRVKIIWGLYILASVNGLTAIVGVVLAYVWRREIGGVMASHVEKQIQVFWISFGLAVLGILLLIVGIGFLLLLAAGLYIIVMGVMGLIRAFDGKPFE